MERPRGGLRKKIDGLVDRFSLWLASQEARANAEIFGDDLDREEMRAFSKLTSTESKSPQRQVGISMEVINWENFSQEDWKKETESWNPLIRAVIVLTTLLPEDMRMDAVHDIVGSIETKTEEAEALLQIMADFSSLSEASVNKLRKAVEEIDAKKREEE